MADRDRYWNQHMETLSEGEYHQVQEAALLRQLDYVWANSPFYQEKFKEAGLVQGDIADLDRPRPPALHRKEGT